MHFAARKPNYSRICTWFERKPGVKRLWVKSLIAKMILAVIPLIFLTCGATDPEFSDVSDFYGNWLLIEEGFLNSDAPTKYDRNNIKDCTILRITDDSLVEYSNSAWIYYYTKSHFYTHAGTKGFKVYTRRVDTLDFSMHNDILTIKDSDYYWDYVKYSGPIPPPVWITMNEEPNDNREESFNLSFSKEQYSVLKNGDTTDWFSITLEKDRLYVLEITAMDDGDNLFAELYHEDSLIYVTKCLNDFYQLDYDDNHETDYKWKCPADGKYFFRFYGTCNWSKGWGITYKIEIDTADSYYQGYLDGLEPLETLIEEWTPENSDG